MDSHEIDCKVTEAIGWEYQRQDEGHLAAWTVGDRSKGECPWSPSTSPADALAALEAWCKKVNDCMEINYSPSSFMGQWSCTTDEDPIVHHANSFCEAACAAILAAEASHA